MKRYDVAVVGSGAAGITAALTAQRRGATVAMIERRKIGGECTPSSRPRYCRLRIFAAVKGSQSLAAQRILGLGGWDLNPRHAD